MSGAYTLTDDKIMKSPLKKILKNSKKNLITRACGIGTMVPM